ncbi:MAG: S-layer protein [Methanomicrobiales archaeon]|jgi:hypothetical protein|nr:S-layer protein [Methanomicrobiales archaeon]
MTTGLRPFHSGLILLILTTILLITPAFAGEKYLTGGPALTAAIAGANEFAPGAEVPLTVKVENRGLIDIKFVQSGIIERDDMPNTAKFVKVSLNKGDSPLIIRTDPQMVGDILGGGSVVVSFLVKVPTDASAGMYELPLSLSYEYLREAEQTGQDSIQYRYKAMDETIPLTVKVKSKAMISVISSRTEHLNVGNEGYISLEVRNIGFENATSSVLKVARNGLSPIVPTDSNIFLGDLPAGGAASARFKVSVARDAQAAEYPVDLVLTYKNPEGDTVRTELVTIGVPVSGKVTYLVVSPPASISPGQKGVITIEYRNTGDAVAYNAQARISAVDPFTSNDDTAFLGDMKPGESALARYEVSVDRDATEKEYALDSEVRYRDALDNNQISDTIKVRVQVAPRTGLDALPGGPLILVGLIIVIAVCGYFVYRRMSRRG